MNYMLLNVILAALQKLVEETPNEFDDLTVEAVRLAFGELSKVKDSPVTLEQLEGLRTQKRW